MSADDSIIKQTKCWIESVVIEFNFCPFAQHEFERGAIYYKVEQSKSSVECLQTLIIECNRLNTQDNIATTLVILPSLEGDFLEFLELVALSNQLLFEQGFEGIYQLASFHPEYRFNNSSVDDASNFTNRSPYPMLHILRESLIEAQLQSYPDVEKIPARNIKMSNIIGYTKFKNLLQKCQSDGVD